MDSTFAFPPPRAAVPRPRPSGSNGGPRESNALRASVLDAALELGLGDNSLVAEWMFNNTVQEEEDEESPQSPGLTRSSSAPSEANSSSPRVPSTPLNIVSPAPYIVLPTGGKPVADWSASKFTADTDIPYLPNDPFAASVTFPAHQDIPIPPRPATPTSNKLRKKKSGADGYDSDGGYLSEAAKKKKTGSEELSKKEFKARLKEEKREQKELKEEERKRKKSLGALAKASKKQQQEELHGGGYDSDGTALSKSPFKSKSKKAAKSKNSSTDAGGDYETDAGYQSSGANIKKKSRFFKLGSKSSRGDLHEAAQPVPEPPREPMPLPIAERFASSTGALSPPSNANLKIDTVGISSSVSLNSATTAKPSLPLPVFNDEPLSFQMSPSTEESLPSPALSTLSSAPIKAVQDRSSLSSAETSSSMSSNSRRRGYFSPSQENSLGHGIAESISTINSTIGSSVNHSSISHASTPPVSSYTPPTSSTGGALRPPSISFPLTRSASPMGLPSSPFQHTRPLQVSKHPELPQLDTHSRGASPLPFSPNSPYVMVSPSPNSSGVSSPYSSTPPTSSPSPQSAPPLRPRHAPTNGFGPRSGLAPLPPSTTDGRLSPNPTLRGRRISPLLLPQNLSPDSNDMLPSPNVLAYYDIPPPSPPPMGPLPSVPGGAPGPGLGFSGQQQQPASQLRNKVLERQREVADLSNLSTALPSHPIMRGRESPFPARPVVGLQQPHYQARAESASRSPPPRDFQNSRRVSPPSGRAQLAQGDWARDRGSGECRPSFEDEDAGLAYDGVDEEEDEENLQDVLDRFKNDASGSGSSQQPLPRPDRSLNEHHRALPSRRSFEALREKHESFPVSVSDYYGGQRETLYAWDDDGTVDLAKNRESRWSGSIYSRLSILDADQSEEARERFVQRVEAMSGGGKDRPVVPPVPRIPEGLANANSWNKF